MSTAGASDVSKAVFTWRTVCVPALVVLMSSAHAGCATVSGTGVEGGEMELDEVDEESAVTTTAVKAALIEATDIEAAAIRVTFDGQSIQLDGFVDSEAESRSAEAIAREQAGGHAVVNALEVR